MGSEVTVKHDISLTKGWETRPVVATMTLRGHEPRCRGGGRGGVAELSRPLEGQRHSATRDRRGPCFAKRLNGRLVTRHGVERGASRDAGGKVRSRSPSKGPEIGVKHAVTLPRGTDTRRLASMMTCRGRLLRLRDRARSLIVCTAGAPARSGDANSNGRGLGLGSLDLDGSSLDGRARLAARLASTLAECGSGSRSIGRAARVTKHRATSASSRALLRPQVAAGSRPRDREVCAQNAARSTARAQCPGVRAPVDERRRPGDASGG